MKLNQFLMPENSPIALNQGQVSAYRFDYETEAGVISSAKIRNAAVGNAQIGTAAIGTANIGTLSFNEISGGTATLGGTGNGNGVLNIKDAGGTTKVTGDNTGITITDGKLTFVNSGGTTILDSLGVISSNNFDNDSVIGGVANTTSSTRQNLPGTISLVTTRTSNVLFFMEGDGWNESMIEDTTFISELALYDSALGTSVVNTFFSGVPSTHVDWDVGTGLINSVSYTLDIQSVLTAVIIGVGAGTHNYNMQFRCVDGGTTHINFYTFGFIQLGI